MESQRVKFLISGYLRGWLSFDYTQKTSKLREEIILLQLEEEHYEELLEAKTLMDAALIGGNQNKTSAMINMVDKSYKLLLALKLPDLAADSKIKQNDQEMTKEDIANWKKILEQGQKNLDEKSKKA